MKRKYLSPNQIPPEWQRYFDFDRQEVLCNKHLSIWVTCPSCKEGRWATNHNVRMCGGSPHCQRCGATAGSAASRQYLAPNDVAPSWREYYDFSKQSIYQGGMATWVTCPDCGLERWVLNTLVRRRGQSPYCNTCVSTGARSAVWKGGRKVNNGYIEVALSTLSPAEQGQFQTMANVQGYILEHRLVLARRIGRPLHDNEIVHHLNGMRADNRPENLRLLRKGKHHKGWGDLYYQQLQEALAENERLKEQLRAIQEG